jgi:hypothetical protein
MVQGWVVIHYSPYFYHGWTNIILLTRLQLTTPNFWVIHNVMPSWDLLPPPPSPFFISYLMFSLNSQYRGPNGVQIGKTQNGNPKMGTLNYFFHPKVVHLLSKSWILVTNYGNLLLTINYWLIPMDMAIDQWLLPIGHWVLVIGY